MSDNKNRDIKKYTKRGGDCEYTMDCPWGVDGWCDRPEGDKCEIQKMDEKKGTVLSSEDHGPGEDKDDKMALEYLYSKRDDILNVLGNIVADVALMGANIDSFSINPEISTAIGMTQDLEELMKDILLLKSVFDESKHLW